MDVKILIADDHTVVRCALMQLIQHQLRFHQVKGVNSRNALLRELRQCRYTHLILDMSLSDGMSLEILPVLLKLYPHLQILIFSMFRKNTYQHILEKYPLYGYLQKDAPEKEILDTLHNFLNGIVLHKKISNVLKPYTNPFDKLSERQHQILHYLLQGCNTKEIAARLNIHCNTVSTMKNRIYEKTGASGISELVQMAVLHKQQYI